MDAENACVRYFARVNEADFVMICAVFEDFLCLSTDQSLHTCNHLQQADGVLLSGKFRFEVHRPFNG